MPYDLAKGGWVGPRFSLFEKGALNMSAPLDTPFRARVAAECGAGVALLLCFNHLFGALLNAYGSYPTWVYMPDRGFLVWQSVFAAMLAAYLAAYLRRRQPLWLLIALLVWAVALLTRPAWHVLGHTGFGRIHWFIIMFAIIPIRGALAVRRLGEVERDRSIA